MKSLLVSIIVPVYNGEKYIEKCILSIINQSYDNIEIILVDDGSTDSSGEICEQYAKKDYRIKVLHKENGGVSSARNNGLDICTGDYIAFVDSDDWIDRDFIECMIKYATKDNIVCCGLKIISENSILDNRVTEYKEYDIENFIKKLNEYEIYVTPFKRNNPIGNYMCNKIFPVKCFEKLRFPENRRFEDMYLAFDVFLKVKKATVLPVSKYNYFQHTESFLHTPNVQSMFNAIEAVLKQEKDIKFNKEILRTAYVQTIIFCLYTYGGYIKGYYDLSKEQLTYIERLIDERKKYIFNDQLYLKIKLFLLLHGSYLLKILFSFRRIIK